MYLVIKLQNDLKSIQIWENTNMNYILISLLAEIRSMKKRQIHFEHENMLQTGKAIFKLNSR